MKKHIRTIVILLSAMLLLGCAKPEKTASFEPFYRFDVSGPTAWKEPLKNVRYLTYYSKNFPSSKVAGMNCFVNVVPLLFSTPACNLRLRLYYQKK